MQKIADCKNTKIMVLQTHAPFSTFVLSYDGISIRIRSSTIKRGSKIEFLSIINPNINSASFFRVNQIRIKSG